MQTFNQLTLSPQSAHTPLSSVSELTPLTTDLPPSTTIPTL